MKNSAYVFYWSFHRNLSRSLMNLSNVSKSKVLNFQGNLNLYFGDDDIFQTRWFKSGPVVQTVLFYGHGQSVTLAFQKKNKAIRNVDLIQWDRKHLCFINASIWFSHWWSIVTFLLISCKQFKGSHEKCQDFSTWSRQAKQFGNLVVINYLEKGLNKKNISKWTNENSNLLHSQHPATSWFFVCLFVLGLGLDVSHVAHSLPFA